MLDLSCSALSARAGRQQQYPQGAQDPAYTYLYDRRFSGGRSSYNAVFSQNSIRLTECLFYLVLNLYYSVNSAMFSWIINSVNDRMSIHDDNIAPESISMDSRV